MKFPKPEAGLVIRYSYLWLEEFREGREEGLKDRPCAIVVASLDEDGRTYTLVVPITHRAPLDLSEAMELPQAIKRHLGLDDARSWVVLSESNLFEWPGPDVRPLGSQKDREFSYGFLPPRFFADLRQRFLAVDAQARARVVRTE